MVVVMRHGEESLNEILPTSKTSMIAIIITLSEAIENLTFKKKFNWLFVAFNSGTIDYNTELIAPQAASVSAIEWALWRFQFKC